MHENKNSFILENNQNETKRETIKKIAGNQNNKKYTNSFIFQTFFILNFNASVLLFNFRFIIIYLIVIFLPIYLPHKIIVRKLNSNDNYISLFVNGKKKLDILNKNFNVTPDKILINGVAQNETGKTVYLNDQQLYNITIIFYSQILSSREMFKDLSSIKEIDFSNFDSSMINDSSYMFRG